MVRVQAYGLVAQLVHEIRFPIPLESRRIERVEHALQYRMRQWADKVQGGLQESADRTERLLGFLQRAGVTPHDSAHLPVVEMLGERRPRRHRQEREETVEVVQRLGQELAVPSQHFRRLVEFPKHRTGVVRMDWVCLEHEGGDHAEVSSTPSQAPVEIFVARGARGHEAAVGKHHVSGDQVVDRQAALAGEMPEPAAQREPSNAGGRDDPRGYGKPERVGGVVDIPPGAASPDADELCVRINVHIPDARKVNDKAIVTDPQTSGIVPAPPHRHEQTAFAPEIHGGNHVRRIGAARDQPWTPVDHPVVDLAGVIVVRITRRDDFPAETCAEPFCIPVALHGNLPELGVSAWVRQKASSVPSLQAGSAA